MDPRRANRWAAQLLSRLGPEQVDAIARQMLVQIDRVSLDRWEAAQARAAALPGTLRPERVKAMTDQFSRELGLAGAAAGAVAVAPAIGTTATLAAGLAEVGWFTARAGDLVLTMAAIHGRPDPTPDERRAWVLAVLIYGSSARSGMSRALNEATTGRTLNPSGAVPLTTLQAANRLMGRALVRRYGTRRGLVALGTALPIGIGAVVGGTANYVSIRNLARDANTFFSKLPYSSIEATSTDITGREIDAG